MWYSFSKDEAANLIPVPVERVKEIMELNKKGVKVKSLTEVVVETAASKPLDYQSPVGSDSITRFEEVRRNNQKRKKKKFKPNGGQGAVEGQAPNNHQQPQGQPQQPRHNNPQQHNQQPRADRPNRVPNTNRNPQIKPTQNPSENEKTE